MPAGTVDAIVEAAAVVMGLQTIVSRNMVRSAFVKTDL
jgi:metal-dependent amidase/aminoacylase/carboxypeptidase family protein